MASLKGLPALPKSLCGISGLGSAQWKEMERIHAMRTMIQQDISRGHQQQLHGIDCASIMTSAINDESSWSSASSSMADSHMTPQGSPLHGKVVRKASTSSLDAQLALLRKEMVGLRQLDMSLLCQLWSLNESLLEYKHHVLQAVADDRSCPVSPISSTHGLAGWDNGNNYLDRRRTGSNGDSDGNCEGFDGSIPDCYVDGRRRSLESSSNVRMRRPRHSLHMLQEFDDDRLSVTSSNATDSSHSSLEFGDV